jgi:hypothetical protein
MSELTLERAANREETVGATFDAGGTVLDAGMEAYFYVPFKSRIVSVTMLADTSGSIVVDVYKVPFAAYPPTSIDSITGGTPPTITSAQTSQDTTLSGWTTLLEAESTLSFRISSVSGLHHVVVILKVIKL